MAQTYFRTKLVDIVCSGNIKLTVDNCAHFPLSCL